MVLGDNMKDKRTEEKWNCLNNKMSKALKIIGIVGVALFAVSLITAFSGFLTGSELLFNTGVSLFVFALPAYFAVFMLIFLIAVIIEEKSKK